MTQPAFALITGASSGIGECFARALAARGHHLILVARSGERLARLAGELKQAHAVQVEVLVSDLSAPGAAAQLAAALAQRGLAVELLVNNAGFGAQGNFWEIPRGRHLEMLRLNIQALVELTHWLLGPMLAARRGAIINVSSTAGFQPMPYTAVYGATKSFVTNFSLALEEELQPHGIRVVTLCPGGTRTNFFQAGNYVRHRLPGGLQAPEEVVAAALRALDRGGGLVIPRLINKLGQFLQRFAPRRLVVKVTAGMFRP
jgi:hypothetical protein